MKVLGIDINGFALDRLRRRAASVAFESTVVDQEESGSSTTIPHRPLVDTWQQNLLQLLDDGNNNSNSTEKSLNSTMRNLVAESAAVVSLHACGAASDLAIAVAVQRGLPFAISPCCIGKVALPQVQSQTQHQKSFAKFPPLPPLSPIMNQSTAPANPIRYPRSVWLQNQITLDEYHLLAAAADTGGPRNDDNDEKRWRRGRMAKQIVEMDRLQWAREYGYYTRMLELPRIGPVYCKRELLLGALRDSPAAHRIANLAVETRIIE